MLVVHRFGSNEKICKSAQSISAGGVHISYRDYSNHTGSHKINNAMGQILLARRLGKKRIIAETGAGQHGVATATVCAKFGMECIVYMGAEDVRRQALNVFRIEMLGAKVLASLSSSFRVSLTLNTSGHPRRVRLAHPQGRRQRSLPRLGHQPREYALPCRLSHRTPPLPDHCPRLPKDHRRGDQTATSCSTRKTP